MTPSGHSGLIAATDESAARLQDLQLTIGEGPAVDAFSAGQPVIVPELAASSDRWTGFVRAAEESGVQAMFAFPVHIGAALLGVLVAHRARRGPLLASQFAEGLHLAQLAAYMLVDLLSARRNGDGAADLGESPSIPPGTYLSPEVHQASGMVMVQLDVPIEEALVRLRALAFALDRPLREVARDIVMRNIRLEL